MYDAIVIGAGNSGLVAALRLLKKGKRVLILDQNNKPGGISTSFRRGRFEFDITIQAISEFGDKENSGDLYKLFNDLDLADKIRFVDIPEAFHVYFKDSKEDFVMPFGIEAFTNKMEEYVPGSKKSVEQFFNLALECKEALKKIYIDNFPDEKVLTREYFNFMKVANFNVNDILNSLKMPVKAQKILTTYWTHLGSSANTLSFVHFATLVYSYIKNGTKIPKKTSNEISVILEEEILKLKGEIKYLSTVDRILFKDSKIAGVRLTSGKIYTANFIVCAISPDSVYGKLIPLQAVPKNAIKLVNSRILGPSVFSINLGLNQSAEDLGLNECNYFIYNSSNCDKEYELMNSLNYDGTNAVVINNANHAASPKGTCLINFTTLMIGDVFAKTKVENYFDLEEKIADNIINSFENTTGITLKPYIEEISIISPVTYAKFTNHPNGDIYGYKLTGLDNIIPRVINHESENYIKNLRLCGSFGMYSSSICSSYFSGEKAAREILKDMKEVENNE